MAKRKVIKIDDATGKQAGTDAARLLGVA